LNKGAETVEQKNPIANPLIVLREEFDDWAILFDPDTGNAFGLNPTGVFIWKHLDGKHGVEDIVKSLRDEAEDVPEDAGGTPASLSQAWRRRGSWDTNSMRQPAESTKRDDLQGGARHGKGFTPSQSHCHEAKE
jgi:SynChlorMet cassette protein ScmD